MSSEGSIRSREAANAGKYSRPTAGLVYGAPPTSGSGETAKLLILIGLILQIVEVVILFGLGFVFLLFPVLGAIILLLAVLGIVWVLLVYLFAYAPADAGDYRTARTPTLVFAILSLITIGLISGILYLVAYVKLGDAEMETAGAGRGPGFPGGFPGTKFCPMCGRANPAAGRFCAGCGAALP